MTPRIRNPKEFWSGAMFLVSGLAAVFISRGYSMGSAGRMGPGYFPTALGVLLAVIGVIAIARALYRAGDSMPPFAFRQTALVLVAVVLFGALVRSAGLVAAIFLLVLLSAYASRDFRWMPSLLLALGAVAFCMLVFIKGLGLPIPVFGS